MLRFVMRPWLPPISLSSTVAMTTTLSEIPRTLSMPPAYESQTSTGELENLTSCHGGAASTHVLTSTALHSRHLTAEIPSQP